MIRDTAKGLDLDLMTRCKHSLETILIFNISIDFPRNLVSAKLSTTVL
jgi:hypothetical protein